MTDLRCPIDVIYLGAVLLIFAGLFAGACFVIEEVWKGNLPWD